MPDKTYKMVEIVGVSDQSIQQAVRNGLTKASQTLRNLDWFEVTGIRGAVIDNAQPQFQVQMKVGFRLLDRSVLAGHDEPAGKAAKREKKRKRK